MPGERMELSAAIRQFVHDGASVALEGFTHLIPFAAGHEIIRQQRRELHLIRMTPDLLYDQMIGMGCARKLTFSWGGNPGVGSLHRLRDAVEHAWPHKLELDEHSHAGMAAAFTAGAAHLPFGMLRGYLGTDLPAHNPNIRQVTCPFTGTELAAVPAINPDVTILHAQRADHAGNIALHGILGAAREAALAARAVIVTVEEIVESLPPAMNNVVLPAWLVNAVVLCPQGAYPSYAQGYYERDNAFYQHWDQVARDRGRFAAWMDRHVLQTHGPREFIASLGDESWT